MCSPVTRGMAIHERTQEQRHCCTTRSHRAELVPHVFVSTMKDRQKKHSTLPRSILWLAEHHKRLA